MRFKGNAQGCCGQRMDSGSPLGLTNVITLAVFIHDVSNVSLVTSRSTDMSGRGFSMHGLLLQPAIGRARTWDYQQKLLSKSRASGVLRSS